MNYRQFFIFVVIFMSVIGLVAQPDNDSHLLFQWENAKQPVRVLNYDGTPVFERFYAPTARGLATYDHYYSMWLHGGGYAASDIDAQLATSFRKGNEFAIEFTMKPANITQTSAYLISMASENGENLLISQENNILILDFSTSITNKITIPLVAVTGGEIAHIVISYKSGALKSYKNGKITVDKQITGDLSGWTNQPLTFGNCADLKHPWVGKLNGIAIYAKNIDDSTIQTAYTAYLKKIKNRKAIPYTIVQAKLLKCSEIQSPKAILPYTQALAMYEYAVEKIIAGKYVGSKIRVAHWVILDKQLLAQSKVDINKSYRLVLEPFDDNPELDAALMNDTLPFDIEAAQYFDILPPRYK